MSSIHLKSFYCGMWDTLTMLLTTILLQVMQLEHAFKWVLPNYFV